MFEKIFARARGVSREVLGPTIELAVEIAREGREGRRVGTMFIVGDSSSVLEYARPLILDPISRHPREQRRMIDPNLRGTLKELAQLDGAFIVDDEGVV